MIRRETTSPVSNGSPAQDLRVSQAPEQNGPATPQTAGRSRFDRREALRLVLILLLSLTYTLLQLAWSKSHYRLGMEPIFDDNEYLLDGLVRLQTFQIAGLGAWLNQWFVSPAHSPFESALVCLAFAIFGVHEWAPYLFNGILIFILLWEIGRVVAGLRFGAQTIVFISILCFPLCRAAVVELRPDFAVGLFGALTIWCAFQLAFLATTRTHRASYFLLGGYVALMFLAKPSFLVHSIFIIALVGCVVLFFGTCKLPAKILIVLAMLTGCAVSLLQYFRGLGEVLAYFFANTGHGEMASVWRIQGGYLGSLRYFLLGDGGRMLGLLLWPVLAGILGGFILLARQRRVPDLRFSGFVLLVSLASILAIVYGRVENPYFAFTFQICLVLLFVFCLSAGFEFDRLPLPSFAFLAITIGLGLFTMRSYVRLLFLDVNHQRAPNRKALTAIVQDLKYQPLGEQRPPRIGIFILGVISPQTQDFYARKEHRNLLFSFGVDTADFQEQVNRLAQLNYAEMTEADSSLTTARNIPFTGIQDRLLHYCLSNPDFRLVTKRDAVHGHLWVFRRSR
jgi:hypothetical protein